MAVFRIAVFATTIVGSAIVRSPVQPVGRVRPASVHRIQIDETEHRDDPIKQDHADQNRQRQVVAFQRFLEDLGHDGESVFVGFGVEDDEIQSPAQASKEPDRTALPNGDRSMSAVANRRDYKGRNRL